MVRAACAIDWLDTPSARALAWSTSSRSTLTDSFQLSFTPRMLGFWRIATLTSSARPRSTVGSLPTTRNCTGYGTGGPLGSSLTRPRTSGNSVASRAGKRFAQPLAGLQVLRQHDELRHVGLRKDLVQRQVEARHARTRPRCSRCSRPALAPTAPRPGARWRRWRQSSRPRAARCRPGFRAGWSRGKTAAAPCPCPQCPAQRWQWSDQW